MTRYRLHLPLLILPALALVAGCDPEAGSGEPTVARPVRSVAASAAQTETVRFPGVVQAGVQTDLAFLGLWGASYPEKRCGDLVRAGDIVAGIDPSALELAVRSAEADMRNAERACSRMPC